ncbi:fibronectin type III domain-containing protein [Arenibacter sp. GZD96]|uniref:CBM96 family carbohydrate-binding protein n=1 Tax=Aurantibrevibacter litoralis TaxID=3106030 RepID=UPI002AFF7A7F|nr:fibronectin type III domain-containing protein [Arenibacter sp. GZD-96]MEA1786087.1 fibronectin type III domain-containing protein [Arenibacter sp. GZD-96]
MFNLKTILVKKTNLIAILTFVLFGQGLQGNTPDKTEPAPAQVTASLAPTDDVHYDSNSSVKWRNDTNLRLEYGVRTAYLKYDLSGINGTITSAYLEFTVASDAGSGTCEIFKGTSNNWTETTINDTNKPGQGALVGSINQSYSIGTTYQVPIDGSSLGTDLYSLVLAHTTTSDFDMASKENATYAGPTLYITYTENTGDTQLPTAPTLSTTAKTDTTVDLAWSGATDNVGVTGYRVFRDGALEASLGNVGTYQVTGLSPSTAYSFTVRALDAAGNESLDSNALPVTTDPSTGGGGGNWSLSGSTVFYNGGNVGIGTSDPGTFRLAVNGNVHAKEVKVDLVGWADYVFAEDYGLPSLEEVERHILEKGRLPNIPSAAEVETNGIELGEMNRLLLAKIEELTLYLLEQEKRIRKLEKNIKNK